MYGASPPHDPIDDGLLSDSSNLLVTQREKIIHEEQSELLQIVPERNQRQPFEAVTKDVILLLLVASTLEPSLWRRRSSDGLSPDYPIGCGGNIAPGKLFLCRRLAAWLHIPEAIQALDFERYGLVHPWQLKFNEEIWSKAVLRSIKPLHQTDAIRNIFSADLRGGFREPIFRWIEGQISRQYLGISRQKFSDHIAYWRRLLSERISPRASEQAA